MQFFVLASMMAGISSCAVADEIITHAEQITYDWLVNQGEQTGYTDHIAHFQQIFNAFNVKTFLEFGLGFSTKYFLDHCDKVISVEFVTNGYGPEWMKRCLDLYEGYSRWIPIAYFSGWPGSTSWAPYKYFGSEHVYVAASYQCSFHKDYALIDRSYLEELNSVIVNLVKSYQIDCAFVDSGIYLRGDLVTLLFHNVPVIVAHDTMPRIVGYQSDVYGYSRITTPEDYEEIEIQHGMGSTIWVRKQPPFEALIQALKEYSEYVQDK
jgi:hypothetical protein